MTVRRVFEGRNSAMSTAAAASVSRPADMRLHLLGPVRLTDPRGAPIAVPSRKCRALLASLALGPGGRVTRARLAELLWGDRAEPQAKASLRQAMHELRRILVDVGAEDAMMADREHVALDLERLLVDALTVVDEAATASLVELDGRLGEWQGDIMSDLDGLCPSFDEWLREERARCRDLVVHAVMSRLTSEPPSDLVLRLARVIVRVDPTHEPGHRLLMQLYAAQNDRGGALAHYSRIERFFEEEFGAAPHEATREAAMGLAEAAAPGFAATPVRTVGRRPRLLICDPVRDPPDKGDGSGAAVLLDDLAFMLERSQEIDLVHLDDMSGNTDESDLHDLMLHAKVRSAGELVRVYLWMTPPSSRLRVWSERFDVPLHAPPQVADRTTARLAAAVLAGVAGQMQTMEVTGADGRTASYAHFMRGRTLVDVMPTRDRLRQAMAHFEDAVADDPRNLIATIYLVRLLNTQLFETEVGADPAPARQRARELATRAFELDPRSAIANVMVGWCNLRQRRFGEAKWYIEHALELNPHHPERLTDAATAFMYLGDHERALSCLADALAMGPAGVDQRWADALEVHVMRRDFATALEAADKLRSLDTRRLAWLCVAAAHGDRPDRAAVAKDGLLALGETMWVGDDSFTPARLVEWLFHQLPFARSEDEILFRRGLEMAGVPV